MRRAVVSTTSTPSTHVPHMDAVATRLGRRRSPSATSARDTRSKEPNLRQSIMSFPTRATAVAVEVDPNPRGTVGDDREADVAAWREYRLRNSGVSSRAGDEERRWQYAMRITASVFGAPSAFP